MQTQDAKKIPIENLLSSLGYFPKKRKGNTVWYCSPLRKEKEPSFKVNQGLNTWYDFGLGQGGNILDLVMEYRKTDVCGALSFLDGLKGISPVALKISTEEKRKIEVSESTGVEVRKVKGLENKVLLGYLSGRGVSIEVARKYLVEIYYQLSGKAKPFFGVAMKNDSGGYEVRNEYFKGSLLTKDITTIKPVEKAAYLPSVAVFEGFTDFLSLLTEQKILALKTDAIILNSTSQAEEAIFKIRERNYKKVYAFFDNDDAGRFTFTKVYDTLSNIQVKDMSYLYQGFKDLNEKLVG